MLTRDSLSSTVLLAFFISIPHYSSAFYLPGVAPTTYKFDDKVPLQVNRLSPLTSDVDGTLHSVVSFDYYHPAFHFCRPSPQPEYVPESLGSILFGDRIMTSPFELKMAHNETCKILCTGKKFDPNSAQFVNRRIAQGFAMNWLVDGLPAGQLIEDEVTNTKFYSQGFALGSSTQKDLYFNNHYDILVDYHETSPGFYRVVGVIVQPDSRAVKKRDGSVDISENCGLGAPKVILNEKGETEVDFTYSVYWLKSSTAWATRWDKYLHVFDPKIHWFSLINSTIIVVFLVITVMSVLLRALKKDIARYNRLDSFNLDDLSGTSAIDDGIQEDSGWKLVHGDVFRSPSSPLILSVFLGNGAQLFIMTGLTIIFALLGFLSPSNRGSLGTIMVLLYTVLGSVGGYVSARVYNSLGGENWRLNIALTPTLVPGIVFSTFFMLNLFLWAKESSGAVPFTTMLVLVGIWFLISVPLSLMGSWFGFRQASISSPVHINQIPRQIPPCSVYLKPIPSMLLVGILPFGAIFVELYFIMSSIWFSKAYYMFGFLFLCYSLMVITCAAVTILMVYFLLCSENYHWHWRSFTTAGASAGYVFANAIIYWLTKLQPVGS
ncbi:putative endosomal integral membrane protein [Erysiphe pulchra]|uniref:Transmembrane 9 superfamily member n=1 Tax=Erysiphe pulchra TaxID=225359 RepID=A0A2S4PSX6_9PEZI|nr:putative endosomal integral membrane protein [Erysiphe pulchra]